MQNRWDDKKTLELHFKGILKPNQRVLITDKGERILEVSKDNVNVWTSPTGMEEGTEEEEDEGTQAGSGTQDIGSTTNIEGTTKIYEKKLNDAIKQMNKAIKQGKFNEAEQLFKDTIKYKKELTAFLSQKAQTLKNNLYRTLKKSDVFTHFETNKKDVVKAFQKILNNNPELKIKSGVKRVLNKFRNSLESKLGRRVNWNMFNLVKKAKGFTKKLANKVLKSFARNLGDSDIAGAIDTDELTDVLLDLLL